MLIAEIQAFIDYIKSMGINAWIPDTPGLGPKMSVPDQCRSNILCLEYKGTDVYSAYSYFFQLQLLFINNFMFSWRFLSPMIGI
jgi:hypothetical protein